MKSYESSTATLRAILAHPSLERSHVDETMEALAEANADAREVDDAVRIGGNVALGVDESVDDAELEEEWRQLVREVEATEGSNEEESVGRKLQEVPKTPANALKAEAEPVPQAHRGIMSY